jgi:hypothetical protein
MNLEEEHRVPLDSIDTVERQDSNNPWIVCGKSLPRSEIVFFSQVILIYVVCCICLANLTTGRGDSNLWSALLSGCLGYLLPSPSIKQR